MGNDAEADARRKPDERVMAAARELVSHLELVNVAPVKVSASLVDEVGGRQPTDVRFTVESSYSAGKGTMANRFRYQITLVDEEASPVAELDFTLQVDYDVEPEFEPDEEAAEFVTSTTGMFGAYPYARELAQNLTTRLQLDPLVLGLLPRGTSQPASITRVARQGG